MRLNKHKANKQNGGLAQLYGVYKQVSGHYMKSNFMIKTVVKISLLSTLLFISCRDITRSMNDPGVSLSHLEYLALEKGDTDAYETLDIAYLDYPQGDFFPIAKKMADKYDYPQAYFDVYFQLLKPTRASGTTLSLDSCDEKTRKIALSYLIQAYNKGHHQAPLELSNLYYEGKFVPKDTILSKKLENRYDSIMTELIEKSKK